MMLKPIGVIGAGGWGIALTKLLADKGEQVTLWCHGAESYRELQEYRESRTYLPGITLASNVSFTRSIAENVSGKSLILCAVPSNAVREVLAIPLPPMYPRKQPCFAAPRGSKKKA